MEPGIKPGSYILIYVSNHITIKPGSIVLADIGELGLIIKRVIAIYDYGIELRGDNLLDSQDSRQFGLISKDQIIGKVIYY